MVARRGSGGWPGSEADATGAADACGCTEGVRCGGCHEWRWVREVPAGVDTFANDKLMSLMYPLMSSRKFSGLRSRAAMRCEWR